jgi:hypothetical protein
MSDDVRPSEQRGGTNPGDEEAREKGAWVQTAKEGIVPAELGGSDAAPSGADPEYSSAALGRTTGSDAPATEGGIDPAAGDRADAVTDGGPEPPEGVEPDLKDASAGPRQADRDSGR